MAKKSDGGKGSTPRPFEVSNDQYASNWDAIFGKKKKTEDLTPEEKLSLSSSDEQERLNLFKK